MKPIETIINRLRVAMTDARQNESHFESWMILNEAICDAIDALSEQPAQQQEPVAWDNCRSEKQCRSWCGNSACASHWNDTSPPASKPFVGLTDVNEMVEAELTHYWNGEYADTTGARDQLTDFARAIEAKLREKNT